MRFRVCFLIAGLSVVSAYVSTQELTTELLSGLELRNIGPGKHERTIRRPRRGRVRPLHLLRSLGDGRGLQDDE